MNINLSLFGQMITFAIFVWFTMKYVWPPIMAALGERQQTIADGLASAEEGQRKLEEAKVQSREALAEARTQARHIVEDAKKRAAAVVDEGKSRARDEADRLIAGAHAQIEQDREATKQALYQEVAQLVVLGTEKLLGKAVDSHANDELFNALVSDIQTENETWQN